MPSRQDQLHSYQFAVRRVVSALVLRETDPAQSPLRRAAGATLASVLVAVIALGVVAVYGVLTGGGSDQWRDDQAVIVEKESGARYVFRDGRLHPVLNYASARLIVGAAAPPTVLVSRRSIQDVPRGAPLGIAGAPDSLPPADRLAVAAWTVCSTAGGDGGAHSTVLVGGVTATGRPLGEAAVLGRHPGAGSFLIWHGRRHPIDDAPVVLAALGWAGRAARPIDPALVNVLEVGDRLGLIEVPGRGERFADLPGARVGQVFVVRVQSGARLYALATRAGLAGITQVQADILLSDPRTRDQVGQREPTPLAQGDYAAARPAADLRPDGATAPPERTPTLAPAADSLCAEVRDDTGVAEVRLGHEPAPGLAAGPAPATGRASVTGVVGPVQADRVVVPPGRAALVRSAPAPGVPEGTLWLVTDVGQRHPLSTPATLVALGYGSVRPLILPAGLVALLPAGPALDPDRARAPA